MSKQYSEFIIWAKKNNWDIINKGEYSLKLNNEILSRYKDIPNSYLEFLRKFKRVISPDEKTWFLCEGEYNNNSDIVFKWNEFEMLSLEVADGDEEWKSEITSWWDNNLPIIMSVDGGYSFYAIDLYNDRGAIVKGYEPEFEEVEKVADTIEDFLELIMLDKIKL